MYAPDHPKKIKKSTNVIPAQRIDRGILYLVIALVVLGIFMIYSASYYEATVKLKGDASSYLRKSIIFAGLGFLGMFFAMNIDYRIYKSNRFVMMIVAASVIFLLLVWTPIGIELNGARRWVGIGETVSFQPAEIAKFANIFILAFLLEQFKGRINIPVNLGLTLLAPLVFCALLFFQPNMSTILLILGVSFGMIVIAGLKKKYIVRLIMLALILIPAVVLSADYRRTRVLSFLSPENATDTATYQALQSLYAISSGGLFGVGIGNSRQKFLYLPEAKNDFIFAIVSEELGFIGAALMVLLFTLLIIRCFRVAKNAPNFFYTLLISGIAMQIGLQMIMNIGVATSSMPNTGVGLPFVGYGGTSLSIFMTVMGVVLNISRYEKGRVVKERRVSFFRLRNPAAERRKRKLKPVEEPRMLG